MGTYDDVSHDWNDGVMANVMRQCSKDMSERRKWIVFDGPIDPVWVENLNSVMDDNKKLTLSTGETIKMTSHMTVVIEAEDLTNCTPATISRCGMIYMRDDIIPLKAQINKWIKSLPLYL
jgi:dynein heavy chain